MKKLFSILTVLGIISLSSCKRDWICQCTDSNDNTTNTAINGGTFLHAEHTCKATGEKCSLITESN
jgi:hypothetical protein